MFLHPVNVCVQYNPKLLIHIYMLFTDVRHKVHSLAQNFCKCRFPTYTYCSTTEYFLVCYMKTSLKHSWLSVIWLWIWKLSINRGSAIVKNHFKLLQKPVTLQCEQKIYIYSRTMIQDHTKTKVSENKGVL